jgi:hypothetical protein
MHYDWAIFDPKMVLGQLEFHAWQSRNMKMSKIRVGSLHGETTESPTGIPELGELFD